MDRSSSGCAVIKQEYLLPNVPYNRDRDDPDDRDRNDGIVEGDVEAKVDDLDLDDKVKDNDEPSEKKAKFNKPRNRGQNKNRPKVAKIQNEDKLCPHYYDGMSETSCPKLPQCKYIHDVKKYLDKISDTENTGKCFNYITYGKCSRGLSCLFYKDHFDETTLKNIINDVLWSRMAPAYESTHKNIIERDSLHKLHKKTYDFSRVEKIVSQLGNQNQNLTEVKDFTKMRPEERKKLNWEDKLYLAPLTTVGNLPFRRLCVDYGADITCSEMSLATSILQGSLHEFALQRRHSSEKFWGIQLCASSGINAAKAAEVLADIGVDYDFVDLNMGCPLDPIYRSGAGSGLMCRTKKFENVVQSMVNTLNGDCPKPFTVKMRSGIKTDKNFAHTLIPFCRDNGVSMVTVHGRTREQRYTKTANWDYVAECAKVANPMPLFGNGDVYSWEEYNEKKEASGVAGIMIGRGALIKPWVFQEIKEQRAIDMNSSQRLELIQKFANYGIDHWGSDTQGVENTRRFMLEWLSFFHRYVPYGILERTPHRLNERPPRYRGRDEMETLLHSSNSADWVKISEMFLGRVPPTFAFMPKHKANSWGDS